MAQILGAIFSGNINITSVADQTVGLVPGLIRAQLMSLTNILSGQSRLPTFPPFFRTTPRPTTQRVRRRSRRPRTTTETTPEVKTEAEIVVTETSAPVVVTEAATQAPVTGYGGGSMSKYKIRGRPTIVPAKNSALYLNEDDEMEVYENKLLEEITKYRPYVKNREARFVEPFTSLLNLNTSNFNASGIATAVPAFVNSARQAMLILQNLGVLDEDLGIGDVIDNLNIFDL